LKRSAARNIALPSEQIFAESPRVHPHRDLVLQISGHGACSMAIQPCSSRHRATARINPLRLSSVACCADQDQKRQPPMSEASDDSPTAHLQPAASCCGSRLLTINGIARHAHTAENA